MSCFNSDRATLNEQAVKLDNELINGDFDKVLKAAFDSGMNIDEIGYVVTTHVERTVRRLIVQNQLKQAANKDK